MSIRMNLDTISR